MLGIVCVTTLIFTGLINATFLVGSPQKLLVTEYGRVLTVKITIFAVMLAFAVINRFYLRPQLASNKFAPQSVARHYLIRNCAIELALGFCILLIVGILGTLHRAIHFVIP
jgi:putative copper resistance protein D